jgi:hypothetical protein
MGGSMTSTACAITSGTCSTDGSSNSGANLSNLSYASGTGKFSGSIITNQCNDHERLNSGGGSPPGNNAVSCIEQVRWWSGLGTGSATRRFIAHPNAPANPSPPTPHTPLPLPLPRLSPSPQPLLRLFQPSAWPLSPSLVA